MAFIGFGFGLHLGPRIEVYPGGAGRQHSRPLHVDDGMIHVRRTRAYGTVFVRRRRSSSFCVYRTRYRSPSPSPSPSPEPLPPQIIEVEPRESCQRRWASSPSPGPQQQIHTHFYQPVSTPIPTLTPTPAPAPAPREPAAAAACNPLGERVEGLAARNGVLEAEMRELREQVRGAQREREVEEQERERESSRAWRRPCGDCGRLRGECRCGEDEIRSAMRRRSLSSSSLGRYGYGHRYGYGSGDGGVGGGGARLDAPRPVRRRGVRWVDECDDWD